MFVFLPSWSISLSARMIIERSRRTRFRMFSSPVDFFSNVDEDFSFDANVDDDLSRYSIANECDLLLDRFSRAGSCVKAGAMALMAGSLNLRFNGFTYSLATEHSPPPVPSTIGRSSRYKSHLPSGLSFPTWCGQSMSTST